MVWWFLYTYSHAQIHRVTVTCIVCSKIEVPITFCKYKIIWCEITDVAAWESDQYVRDCTGLAVLNKYEWCIPCMLQFIKKHFKQISTERQICEIVSILQVKLSWPKLWLSAWMSLLQFVTALPLHRLAMWVRTSSQSLPSCYRMPTML